MVANAHGDILERWSQWDHLFEVGGRGPHRIKINPYDPERHVWVVDDSGQQIYEFSHDGTQLVLALGESGVGGTDDKHFGRPTDIAWLPDGTMLVSDGYANSRVVKLDRNGKYLMSWGRRERGLANSTCRMASTSTQTGACTWPTLTTAGSRCSMRTARSWISGRTSGVPTSS